MDRETERRLREAAATGLDMSPGDELCTAAVEEIDSLRETVENQRLRIVVLQGKLSRIYGSVI